MLILGFDYPHECYYLLEHDMWCRPVEGGCMRVGVTAFGIHLSSDFYMCRPKAVGTPLAQGETLAVAELSKSVVTIKTPVSGIVERINPLLEETPEVIHRDPYGQGWLAELRPTRWQEDLAKLARAGALQELATTRMKLENLN